MLREARGLATKLVGGDGTNISIVHPIRWPGSWHRKATPRLAKIVASSDNEIDLAEALELLRDASGAATFAGFGFKTNSRLCADDPADVASALSVIPNDNLVGRLEQDRHGHLGRYGRLGSRARGICGMVGQVDEERGGDHEGALAALQDIAADRIGFGTLVYWARHYSPGWTLRIRYRCGAPEQGARGAADRRQDPRRDIRRAGGFPRPRNHRDDADNRRLQVAQRQVSSQLAGRERER